MTTELSGNLDGKGLRIGIAVSRFNGPIVEDLLAGALDGLIRHGVADDAITVARCPGCWELPLVAKRFAVGDQYDAVIALGAVIRGETSHYDHIVAECVKGLGGIQQETGRPVVFGVLTTDTVDQAVNRAGVKLGNKGFDCAMAAIEMARLLARF